MSTDAGSLWKILFRADAPSLHAVPALESAMPDQSTNVTANSEHQYREGAAKNRLSAEPSTSFVGWWLGALALSLAYCLFVLVITIPLGVKIINPFPT